MSQTKAKRRRFQPVWTEKYGAIDNGDGYATCALCTDTITARTYNITRHFKSRHKNVNEMANDIKIEYIAKRVLHWEIGNQHNVLKDFVTNQNHAVSASYVSAHSICTNGRPFADAEFLKNAFLTCSYHLFNDFSNKEQIIERIKEMLLSATTVEQYVQDMTENIDMQLKDDLLSSDAISIALDEYSDGNGIIRLAIIIRYVSIESSVIDEELCIISSINEENVNIANHVFTEIQKFTHLKDGDMLDLKSKLFSITTDAAMRGWSYQFRMIMETEVGHPLVLFESIIHEETLFFKASTHHANVMEIVVKVVKLIVTHSDLTNESLKTLLEEVELNYGDFLSQLELTWLSRGKVLNRFIEALNDIKLFLIGINETDHNLNDNQLYLKLLFLADVMSHYNEFKLRLQGDNHTILKIYEEWKGFIAKLQLLGSDLKIKLFLFFPLLKKQQEKEDIEECNLKLFEAWIVDIRNEFENRFQSFKNHAEMMTFIIKPDELEGHVLDFRYFQYLGTDNFNSEMIDFRNSVMWVNKFNRLREELRTTEDNHLQIIVACWTALPPSYFTLKKVAFAILSTFGTTNKFEKIFSHMKYILSKNNLSNENFEAGIRLKMSKYTPELGKLSSQS